MSEINGSRFISEAILKKREGKICQCEFKNPCFYLIPFIILPCQECGLYYSDEYEQMYYDYMKHLVNRSFPESNLKFSSFKGPCKAIELDLPDRFKD